MRYLALPTTQKMTLKEYRHKFLEELVELMDELGDEEDLEALASEFIQFVLRKLHPLFRVKIIMNGLQFVTTAEKNMKMFQSLKK